MPIMKPLIVIVPVDCLETDVRIYHVSIHNEDGSLLNSGYTFATECEVDAFVLGLRVAFATAHAKRVLQPGEVVNLDRECPLNAASTVSDDRENRERARL